MPPFPLALLESLVPFLPVTFGDAARAHSSINLNSLSRAVRTVLREWQIMNLLRHASKRADAAAFAGRERWLSLAVR